jgi:hypothetical protein
MLVDWFEGDFAEPYMRSLFLTSTDCLAYISYSKDILFKTKYHIIQFFFE